MIAAKAAVTRADVAAHYDDLDPFYRAIWGEHVHHGLWWTGRETPAEAVENLSRHVADRAQIARGTAVCDVGCGYGATAQLFAEEMGARVVALTVSERQFEICRAKAAANLEFLLGDWLENEFPPESFDAVIAIESSEHMEDKQRFFDEAARVLRPGGRLVVCAWLAGDQPGAFARRHLVEAVCVEGRMPGLGTEGSYRRMTRRAGLEEVGFEDVTRRVERTWRICAGRFIRKLVSDPRYLRFLVRRGEPNRIFALTLFRLMIGFRTGVLRYGILTALKPEG